MDREVAFSPPDITQQEIDEVVAVLRSGWITTGPKTRELEHGLAEFCGTKQFVCLNSATAAMELALRVLGIGEGDEVITTPYTYTATASVILHVGARPVFIDTAKDSFLIDCSLAEQAVTARTKAIIGVDVAGMMCDYTRLIAIAEEKRALFSPNSVLQQAMGRIAVIADASHSLGAVYQGVRSGASADFSAFSFHAVKNLTTAEGGAITWRSLSGIRDEDLYRRFFLYALHGQTKDAYQKTQKGGWEYDILLPGYKNNMPDVLAAIGVAQLRRYRSILARRKEIVELYNLLLSDARFILPGHSFDNAQSSMHLYPLRVAGYNEVSRNRIIQQLAEKGVSANVHYKPLPMFSAYKRLGYYIEDYPCAYAQYQNEITLPLHTRLSDDDVAYVAHSLIRTFLQMQQ